jgi:hypothetical protein
MLIEGLPFALNTRPDYWQKATGFNAQIGAKKRLRLFKIRFLNWYHPHLHRSGKTI